MGKESKTRQILLYISKKHIDSVNTCSLLCRQTHLDHKYSGTQRATGMGSRVYQSVSVPSSLRLTGR